MLSQILAPNDQRGRRAGLSPRHPARVQTKDSLAPWTGLGVFCLYALVPIVAAFALITRRDA
jgi:hypothetical protein